jgi:integral membrane protein (TIGR01906 family)
VRADSNAIKTAARIALAVCTPLLLLLSNLYLLATPAFIRYEYSKPSFPPADLYGAAERLSLAEATLHYMRSGEDVGYLTELQSRGQAVYNAREVRHLVDAKLVMRGALWVHGVCALLCLLAAVYSWRRAEDWPGALRGVWLGCLALVALLIAIGILAYTNFGLFFTVFHRLLFQGDSWLFAFSDTLIQLFPVQFWIDATWVLSLLTVGECVIAGAAAYIVLRRLKAA